jgi:hypothetical protein
MGIADGVDEVHKATVARNVLKGYRPHEGYWPTEYFPAKREKAREKFEPMFQADPELRAIADGLRQVHRPPAAEVCRAPISRSARPLSLLERELQARIEAKTAAHFRERRKAAKVAKRIASMPPTLFQAEPAGAARHEPPPPRATNGASNIVDIPAAAVHEVRSTNDVSRSVPQPAEAVAPRPVAVTSEPAEAVAPRPVAVKSEPAEAVAPRPVAVAPIPEPKVEPVPQARIEPVAPVDAPVAEPVPAAPPAPPAPKVWRPIRSVERLAERVTERVAERVKPPWEEPAVESVNDAPPPRVAERAPEPVVTRVVETVKEPPVKRVVERVVEAVKEPPANGVVERVVRAPAPVTRIGSLGTNQVWRDRVFNSGQRQAERAMWPRPRPEPVQPVAPVIDLPAEPVIDRIGEAAG